MGEYLCWGSEWGLLAKVQGKFTGAFEVTCIFTGAVIYVHFVAEFEGRGQERAERGTCDRSQPYHTGTPGHLWSPGAHSPSGGGVAIEAAGTKEEGIMKFSNLQYRVGKRVGENVKDREGLKGAQ